MTFFPRLALSVGGVLFVGVLGLAWVLFKQVKGHPGAGYLAVWMLLLILPQACAPPSERLLFGASIGSSGLLALFVYHTVMVEAPRWRPRLSRALGVVVLVAAGGVSGMATLVQGAVLSRMADQVREIILTAEVGDSEARRREVFMLQSPNMLVPAAMLSTWGIETGDRQVRFWPMQTGRRGLRWTRPDERTFELESFDQPFLAELLERLFLTGRAPPAPGTKWKTALFTAEATQLDAEGLRSFVVRCPDSLDAPDYRFLVVRGQRLVAVPPPAVGESIIIQAVVPPHSLVP